MKILALDLGDIWIGSAISDNLGITARPYKTVKSTELISFIRKTIIEKELQIIVIGYPKTMAGGQSEQTKKVIQKKEELETLFPNIQWILWDERLSSKQASYVKKIKTKEDKVASHSVAAAIFLTSYLLFSSQNRLSD